MKASPRFDGGFGPRRGGDRAMAPDGRGQAPELSPDFAVGSLGGQPVDDSPRDGAGERGAKQGVEDHALAYRGPDEPHADLELVDALIVLERAHAEQHLVD